MKTTDKNFYKYNGKTFPCDEHTIRQLNYALALNNKSERYVQASLTEQQKQKILIKGNW